jgi:hypothetical protein
MDKKAQLKKAMDEAFNRYKEVKKEQKKIIDKQEKIIQKYYDIYWGKFEALLAYERSQIKVGDYVTTNEADNKRGYWGIVWKVVKRDGDTIVLHNDACPDYTGELDEVFTEGDEKEYQENVKWLKKEFGE